MNEHDILDTINELNEEHYRLRATAAEPGKTLHDSDRTRLARLEQQLKTCWNLLYQHRTLTDPQETPGAALR